MFTLNIKMIFKITSHSMGPRQKLCGQPFSNVFVIYLSSQISVPNPVSKKIEPLTLQVCLFILCYQKIPVYFAYMDLYVSDLYVVSETVELSPQSKSISFDFYFCGLICGATNKALITRLFVVHKHTPNSYTVNCVV